MPKSYLEGLTCPKNNLLHPTTAMKIHSILTILILTGISNLVAQELDDLAKGVEKVYTENKDEVSNAAANFAKKINPSPKTGAGLIDDLKSLDIDKVEKQAKQTANKIIPTVVEKIPATRAKAKAVKAQLANSKPKIRQSLPVVAKPKINAGKVEPAPNLGNYRPEVSTRTSGPLPSSIVFASELSGPTPGPQSLYPAYKPATRFSLGNGYASNGSKADNAVITSNEMEADQVNKTIKFRGAVILEMENTKLECDNLIIQLNSNDKPQTITATGGTVRVQQEVRENGKKFLRVAQARKAVHLVDSKITTLTGGPPQIQNGDQHIQTDSENAVITMNGITQRYTISGPTRVDAPSGGTYAKPARTKITVPIGNGKGLPKKLGLDQKLDIRR